MHRRVAALAAALLAAAGAREAAAQEAPVPPTPSPVLPGAAAATPIEPTVVTPEPVRAVDSQELGVGIGAAIGGRTTPGGLLVEGIYLYQITDAFWFEGAMGISYGGGDAECFRDRADALVCDHDPIDGYGIRVSGGLRWFLGARTGWQPYLRGAVGGQMSTFPEDDLRGWSLPLIAGAGVRVRVAPHVAVGGGGALQIGTGTFGRRVGQEPFAAIALQAGVEFGLD